MATYYVSDATGSDGDDGLSEGNAWATIDKAMDTVAAGDKVWVKADGVYIESVEIDTVGTSSSTIEFEGYTSSTGDGGKAIISADGISANCLSDTLGDVSAFYVFKNFICEEATTANVSISLREVIFKNCQFNNSSGAGCVCTTSAAVFFENCSFFSNSGIGLNASGIAVIIGCRFTSNSTVGIETGAFTSVFNCVFRSNGADAINCLGGDGTYVLILGCTIDGDGKDTNTGIDLGSSSWKRAMVVNNIVYDCVSGIDSAGQGTFFISRNNLLNNNTTAYPGSRFQTFEGEVVSAPQFEDEAGSDYSLGSASPARGAGYDGYLLNGSAQRADIGAIESTPAGGGLLVHPGTSGGARA